MKRPKYIILQSLLRLFICKRNFISSTPLEDINYTKYQKGKGQIIKSSKTKETNKKCLLSGYLETLYSIQKGRETKKNHMTQARTS